jgi:hypothetical protein
MVFDGKYTDHGIVNTDKNGYDVPFCSTTRIKFYTLIMVINWKL